MPLWPSTARLRSRKAPSCTVYITQFKLNHPNIINTMTEPSVADALRVLAKHIEETNFYLRVWVDEPGPNLLLESIDYGWQCTIRLLNFTALTDASPWHFRGVGKLGNDREYEVDPGGKITYVWGSFECMSDRIETCSSLAGVDAFIEKEIQSYHDRQPEP
jgi:hypothetical protein